MNPIGWIKQNLSEKWNRWRINRWLKLRQIRAREGEGITFTILSGEGGLTREETLSRSFLTAVEAAEILCGCLCGGISRVGIATVQRGGLSVGFNFRQIALILGALADLAPLLPEGDREQIATLIEDLRGHAWGGVRRAADAAKVVLKADAETAFTGGAA